MIKDSTTSLNFPYFYVLGHAATGENVEDPFIAVEEIDKEVDTQFAKDIEDQVDIMLFLKPKLPQMLDKVVLRKVKKRD